MWNVVHNVYAHNVTVVNNTRVSYNGPQGVNARPSAGDVAVYHEHVVPAMQVQVQHAREAEGNRQQFYAVNQGRPAAAVVAQRLPADRTPPAAIRPAPEVRQPMQPANAGRPGVVNQPVGNGRPEQPRPEQGRPEQPRREQSQPGREQRQPEVNQPQRPVQTPVERAPQNVRPVQPAPQPQPRPVQQPQQPQRQQPQQQQQIQQQPQQPPHNMHQEPRPGPVPHQEAAPQRPAPQEARPAPRPAPAQAPHPQAAAGGGGGGGGRARHRIPRPRPDRRRIRAKSIRGGRGMLLAEEGATGTIRLRLLRLRKRFWSALRHPTCQR